MAVMRIQKTENYTVMSNYHLDDTRLSLKAKGLLSFMLSKPDYWDYSLNGLVAQVKEGKTAVISALKELKAAGYLTITRTNGKDGRYEYVYDVYEKPNTRACSPASRKPSIQNQSMENELQVNTNIVSTNIVSTKRKCQTTKSRLTPIPEEAYELAELLHRLALKNKPNRVIGSNWRQKWAEEFDKLHRINRRSWEEIGDVIRWSQSQSGWWWDKIYSAEKIRAKIDNLESQMLRERSAQESNFINLNEVV